MAWRRARGHAIKMMGGPPSHLCLAQTWASASALFGGHNEALSIQVPHALDCICYFSFQCFQCFANHHILVFYLHFKERSDILETTER